MTLATGTDAPHSSSIRTPYRVLVVHNFYQQPGGEDQVFKEEVALLQGRGHAVETYTVHNDAVANLGKLKLAKKTLWNDQSYREIRQIVSSKSIDIVHFHNTFPLVSPAAYYAAHDGGAAVVQTLHNYRLMCPVSTFYRDGHVCEDCKGKFVPWPGVVHKCYRDSYAASAMTAAMLTYHRAKRTYRDEVDVYIALTEFSKSKFVEGGFPESKFFVKPNFVDPDPGEGAGDGDERGRYVVFIGRLTEEKGIDTMLAAWREAPNALPRLKILGDGPMRAAVEQVNGTSGIEYLGRRPMAEVYAILSRADALIFPSVWYEGLPRTIVESFACGTPVIASRLGSMAELVGHGVNGLVFEPGDSAGLARAVFELSNNSTPLSDRRRELRSGARAEFLRIYTAAQNYPMLIKAYARARNEYDGSRDGVERRRIGNAAAAQAARGD